MQGLADFQSQPGDPPVLPPFGGSGPYTVLPDSLSVGLAADGRPDLSLELVRGTDPGSPPAPYAVLELGLTATSRLDDALAQVRASDPQATVARAAFDGGSLALRALDPGAPDDLLRPAQVVWHGLDGARWVLRLSDLGGATVRRALLDSALAVSARARLAVLGVGPRLPLAALPDLARLRAVLAGALGAGGMLERDAAVAALRGDPRGLPFEFTGDATAVDREALAQALTDAALPLVASEDPAAPGSWRLSDPAVDPPEPAPLRLSEPRVTRRPIVLDLDPLAAARELVASAGIDAVVHEAIVPKLTFGMYDVRVTANLPSPRAGVLALGATIVAPPAPPERPQAATAGVELAPPDDAGSVHLQLAATEQLAYRWTTYAVTRAAARVARLEAAERDGSGEHLDLQEDDFPVRFVSVGAAATLLDLADVSGTLRWTYEGAADELPFTLVPGAAQLALALPRDAADAALDVQATDRASGTVLALTGLPAQDLALDLHLFSGYGPHAVEVSCTFANGSSDCALDLVPEDRVDVPTEVRLLHLTRDEPSERWQWIAYSPFAPGYRYRLHPLAGQAEPPWSDVHPPSEALTVTVGAA